MQDPNFVGTVSYICEHNKNGAIGIVINRPLPLVLADVLDQLDITMKDKTTHDQAIVFGGPLHQERGFVIHQPVGQWDSSYDTGGEITVTTSRDILEAIAKDKGPEKVLVSLGYSGWGADQLEVELSQNAWIHCPVDPDIIFQTPFHKRWKEALAVLGIDPGFLSSEAGHA